MDGTTVTNNLQHGLFLENMRNYIIVNSSVITYNRYGAGIRILTGAGAFGNTDRRFFTSALYGLKILLNSSSTFIFCLQRWALVYSHFHINMSHRASWPSFAFALIRTTAATSMKLVLLNGQAVATVSNVVSWQIIRIWTTESNYYRYCVLSVFWTLLPTIERQVLMLHWELICHASRWN